MTNLGLRPGCNHTLSARHTGPLLESLPNLKDTRSRIGELCGPIVDALSSAPWTAPQCCTSPTGSALGCMVILAQEPQ